MDSSRNRGPVGDTSRNGGPGRLWLPLVALLLMLLSASCTKSALSEALAVGPPRTKPVGGASVPSQTSTASSPVRASPNIVSPDPTPQPGWQRYENKTLGFLLHYPNGWTLEEGTGMVIIRAGNPDDPAFLSVAVYSGNATPETLVDVALNKRRERFPDLKPFEVEPFMLAGIQAKTLDYTFTGEGGILIYESVVATANNGKGYVVTLSARQKDYEGMLQYFNPMLKSFYLEEGGTNHVEAQLARDILSPEAIVWQKYENKSLGLNLLYPKNWSVSETENSVYLASRDAILSAYFIVKVAPASLSPQQFVAAILERRTSEFPGLEFSGSRAFALGELGVVTADYSYTDGSGVPIHESVRTATVGKRTYALQFGARSEAYDIALELIRPMIDSLQLSP